MSSSSPNPIGSGPEHRKAARVPCTLPVAVVAPGNWPGAEVLDLSRTGVRLAVDLECRETGRPALSTIVEQLGDRLALKLIVDLHPERLGSLVRRAIQVVRIGPVVPEQGIVELGCVLVPPLSEDDAVALGVPLPSEGEAPDIAQRRLGWHAPISREPTPFEAVRSSVGVRDEREYVSLRRVPRPGLGTPVHGKVPVIVQSGDGLHQAPLRGRALELGEAGGVLSLQHDPKSLPASDDMGIAERALLFTRTYGSEVKLGFQQTNRFSWIGKVQVESVGILPEVPGSLILGFSFLERPNEKQRRAIGIAG